MDSATFARFSPSMRPLRQIRSSLFSRPCGRVFIHGRRVLRALRRGEAQLRFRLRCNSTNTNITWSVIGGNAAVGTISANGVYVAPADNERGHSSDGECGTWRNTE